MLHLPKSAFMPLPIKQNYCCMLSTYDSEAFSILSSSLNLVLVLQDVVKDIGLEQLSHPPYPRGLTPNDFDLFCHLKLFHDDNQIKQATSAELYLDSMPSEFYLTGIKELFESYNICIAVKDEYV